MLIYCVFLQEIKTKEMCESMPKKASKWMQTRKQVRGASTKFAETKAVRSRRPSLQPENTRCSEMSLTVAGPCCPDTLMHETLGYKRGSSSHLKGEEREKWPERSFRERNTERNQFP